MPKGRRAKPSVAPSDLAGRLAPRTAMRARALLRSSLGPTDVVERIHDALPAWMAIAVPIGIGAGLQPSEASGLTVDHIDFLRRTMRINRQLVSRFVPTPVLGPPTTDSSNRTIPLAAFLVAALAYRLTCGFVLCQLLNRNSASSGSTNNRSSSRSTS